jgi:hypothetical protein
MRGKLSHGAGSLSTSLKRQRRSAARFAGASGLYGGLSKLITVFLTFATACVFVLASARAAEEGWGTVKGQVVFGGDTIPQPKEIDVSNNQDKQHCLSKGPLFNEEWTIDKDNKGVRWTIVWLAPASAGTPLPVHPSLKEITQKEVTIDQPYCRFVPHALGLRQGQVLVAKNSSPVSHNVNWTGLKNPGGNVLVPAGASHRISDLQADRFPLKLSCNIHPWMSAWVRVFDHPYFAITDENGKFEIKLAPAAKYYLVTWQEAIGFGPGGRLGMPITIKPGTDTDVGKIALKPAESK